MSIKARLWLLSKPTQKGDFLLSFACHRWLTVQNGSLFLPERPFTLFVWFLSSLALSVFPYFLYFSLHTCAASFTPLQPSTWPISVRLLSCTILCVLASRYSSVALLPVALPFIPRPPSSALSLLLRVVKTLYISLKCSLLGSVSSYICLSLLGNSLPFHLAFLCCFSTFGLTFSFNLAASRPPLTLTTFPLLDEQTFPLSCFYCSISVHMPLNKISHQPLCEQQNTVTPSYLQIN